MCNELMEIESECKWILLTRAIILQSLPMTEELHKEIVEVSDKRKKIARNIYPRCAKLNEIVIRHWKVINFSFS